MAAGNRNRGGQLVKKIVVYFSVSVIMAGHGGRRIMAKVTSRIAHEISRYLQQGLTCRQIAKLVGVSRQTVSSVRRGKYNKPQKTVFIDYKNTPPYKCAGCARMVVVRPCPYCAAQNQQLKTRFPTIRADGVSAREGMMLRPAEQARYEEIRRERERLSLRCNIDPRHFLRRLNEGKD